MKMGCKACEGGTCMEHGGKVKDKDRPMPAKSVGELAMGPMPKGHKAYMAEGGEAELPDKEMGSDDMAGVDDELMDMACGELLSAIESKNKKEILESLKAIILSCKE